MTQLQLETAPTMPLIPVKEDSAELEIAGQIWSLPSTDWILLEPLAYGFYAISQLAARLRLVLPDGTMHTTKLRPDLLVKLKEITGIQHRRVTWVKARTLVDYFETIKRKVTQGSEMIALVKQWLAIRGQPGNVLRMPDRAELEDEDIIGLTLIISKLDALPEDIRSLPGIAKERQDASSRLDEIKATRAGTRHHKTHLAQVKHVERQFAAYRLAVAQAHTDRGRAEATDRDFKIVPGWGHGGERKTCAQVATWATLQAPQASNGGWTYQAIDRAIRRLEKTTGLDFHLSDRQRQETWVDDQGIGRPKTVQLYSHAQARIILDHLLKSK